MALLWPDSDLAQARNLLKVSVYVLRKELGEGVILSGPDSLRLGAKAIEIDVVSFEAALARGALEEAVAQYGGPFLDGFFVGDAFELERWMDRERAVLSRAHAGALESLAEAAERAADPDGALRWWQARASSDPFDSRVAIRLVKALDASGNRAGALRHARVHEQLLRDQVGVDPPGELTQLVERLQAARAPATAPPPVGTQLLPAVDTPTTKRPIPSSPPPRGHRRRRAFYSGLLVTTALVVALLALWGGPGRNDGSSTSGGERSSFGTDNVAALELYRRASAPEALRSDSAARAALSLFQRAVDLDPAFAGAHAGLARMYIRVGPLDDPALALGSRLLAAHRHAATAVALDEASAEALATLGIVEMMLYRFGPAESHLLRSLELEESSRTHEWLVALYLWTGRDDEALEQGERAVAADALSATARAELARTLLVLGRCDDAMTYAAALKELDPPLLRMGPIAAQCHASDGRWDAALGAVEPGGRTSGARSRGYWAYFLARSGDEAGARAVLDSLLANPGGTEGSAFWIATALAGLERYDEAFEWLERSVEDHSFSFEVAEPMFAELRADPRYGLLVAPLGLATPSPAR